MFIYIHFSDYGGYIMMCVLKLGPFSSICKKYIENLDQASVIRLMNLFVWLGLQNQKQ